VAHSPWSFGRRPKVASCNTETFRADETKPGCQRHFEREMNTYHPADAVSLISPTPRGSRTHGGLSVAGDGSQHLDRVGVMGARRRPSNALAPTSRRRAVVYLSPVHPRAGPRRAWTLLGILPDAVITGILALPQGREIWRSHHTPKAYEAVPDRRIAPVPKAQQK